MEISEITEEMIEAGFKVISTSGIADEYGGADKLLVAEIFQAMIGSQRQEMKQKPQAKIDGLGRCGTCKHWQRYSDKFDVTAHGKHAGVCNSEKFVCQENTQKEQDSLRCWGYEGDGAFNTGEDFGCVHWTKHPMERWVR
jgi:hypothetical protein